MLMSTPSESSTDAKAPEYHGRNAKRPGPPGLSLQLLSSDTPLASHGQLLLTSHEVKRIAQADHKPIEAQASGQHIRCPGVVEDGCCVQPIIAILAPGQGPLQVLQPGDISRSAGPLGRDRVKSGRIVVVRGCPADEQVINDTAGKRVESLSADEDVPPGRAVQLVVAGSADQQINGRPASERVVAAPAAQPRPPREGGSVDPVVPRSASQFGALDPVAHESIATEPSQTAVDHRRSLHQGDVH